MTAPDGRRWTIHAWTDPDGLLFKSGCHEADACWFSDGAKHLEGYPECETVVVVPAAALDAAEARVKYLEARVENNSVVCSGHRRERDDALDLFDAKDRELREAVGLLQKVYDEWFNDKHGRPSNGTMGRIGNFLARHADGGGE